MTKNREKNYDLAMAALLERLQEHRRTGSARRFEIAIPDSDDVLFHKCLCDLPHTLAPRPQAIILADESRTKGCRTQ